MELHDVYGEWLRSLRAGDRRAAHRAVAAARDAGFDVRTLYLEVFQPALQEIGRLWQENEITVADEHLATAITQVEMAHFYGELFARGGTSGRSLIAACADVERHEVGLRMICDLLELEGWDTHYLGATVPTQSLVAMVEARRPDVVALSAALLPHVPRLREMIAAIRARLGDRAPLILAGGRPFVDEPALAKRIGADLTAANAADAVHLLHERFAA